MILKDPPPMIDPEKTKVQFTSNLDLVSVPGKGVKLSPIKPRPALWSLQSAHILGFMACCSSALAEALGLGKTAFNLYILSCLLAISCHVVLLDVVRARDHGMSQERIFWEISWSAMVFVGCIEWAAEGLK